MKEQKLKQAFKALVAKLARHNYDRLGFEAKDGESDEDDWFVSWLFR